MESKKNLNNIFYIFILCQNFFRVDKKIKTLGSKLSEFPGTSNSKKILKYFINLRMHIMNFMSNLEFYVFYTVLKYF
jgi:hypothetical protein